MGQVDKMTQWNAAMVEQATAASQTKTSRPAAPSRGVAQMKTTGRGGAARAPNAESESWEEF
ncbi:MAG TPA: hypothetical protein VIN77_10060 [Aurantimonas sp.]